MQSVVPEHFDQQLERLIETHGAMLFCVQRTNSLEFWNVGNASHPLNAARNVSSARQKERLARDSGG
jgi:hypothetical protein